MLILAKAITYIIVHQLYLFFFILSSLPLFATQGDDVIDLSTSKQFIALSKGYPSDIEINSVQYAQADSIVFDPSISKYLAKVSIKNTTDRDDEWILDFQNWSYISVYEDSGSDIIVNRKEAGHLLPYNKRHYPFANKNYVLLDIQKDSIKNLHISLESTPNNFFRPTSLNISAAPRALIDKEMRYHERIVWMFVSIYVILFLYNFFILLSVRDKTYVYYLIRAFCITYLVVNNSGFTIPLFSEFESFPKYKSYLESLASAINMICLILFTQSFLSTKKYLPKMDLILKVLLFSIVINLLGVYTRHPFFLVFTLISAYIIAGIITTVGIVSLLKKVPSSKYYVLAYFFSVIGIILLTSVYAGIIQPTNFFTKYPTQTGYALELLFFSFALADKINVLKKQNENQKEMIINQLKEKQELQANINRDLEIKVEERTKEIQSEREKSDSLLLNILPKATADELKQYGKAASKYHEVATIMLTDFTNFTKISSQLGPEILVSELDDLFRKFDEIIERNELEKIKTIGDAYMAAGGLHGGRDDHAIRMVRAAQEIIDYLKKRNEYSEIEWNIRIGIHSGPVVSGVVGKNKFTFDTWGDTVNISSRLEQASEPNKINVSKEIANRIKSVFELDYRGLIEVKGKGKMEMYYALV